MAPVKIFTRRLLSYMLRLFLRIPVLAKSSNRRTGNALRVHPLMLISLVSAGLRDWLYRKNRIVQNLLLIKQLFRDTLFIVKLDHSKTGVLEATIMLYKPFLRWSPINYTNRLVYCRHYRVWSFLLHSSWAICMIWSTRTQVGNGFYFTVMLT